MRNFYLKKKCVLHFHRKIFIDPFPVFISSLSPLATHFHLAIISTEANRVK